VSRRPSPLIWTAAVAVLVLALVGGYAGLKQRAAQQLREKAVVLTRGGDPDAGRVAIGRYGCGGCHEIPGVVGARGKVGPSLKGVGERVYLGGELRNTPENLAAWIADPKAVEPNTAMPRLGVEPDEARDIAAYLYSVE
jgi:cytochrome c2